jgi:hypothetical protein
MGQPLVRLGVRRDRDLKSAGCGNVLAGRFTPIAYWPRLRYESEMEIKLPHMPFKFDSPEGRLEITVRQGASVADERAQPYVAAVTFLQSGPRALERIPLSARSSTYGGALLALTEGFKVTPSAHDKDSVEFRVLTALCSAAGVVDLGA